MKDEENTCIKCPAYYCSPIADSGDYQDGCLLNNDIYNGCEYDGKEFTPELVEKIEELVDKNIKEEEAYWAEQGNKLSEKYESAK